LLLLAIRGNPNNAQALTEEVLASHIIVVNISGDALPLAGMRPAI
jgi:hypothetical protein